MKPKKAEAQVLEVKEQKFDSEFIQGHVHFFLVHLNRLILRNTEYKTYLDYEKKAQHYGKAFLTGYSAAFKTKLADGTITPQFIQSINQQVLSHLPSAKRGRYRNDTTWVAIRIKNNPNASLDGLMEFISRWSQDLQPMHLFHFVPNRPPLPQYSVIFHNQSVRILDSSPPSKILTPTDIRDWLKTHLSNPNYECFLNFNPISEVVSSLGYPDKAIDALIAKKLQQICDQYNSSFKRARTPSQQIKNIIILCQQILQLSPFQDGNARTCYILMNRLLHKVDLSFTLFVDIDRLMTFSVAELTQFVSAGQERYLALCHRQLLFVIDDPFTPPRKLLRGAVLIPDAKIETLEFAKIIEGNLKKIDDVKLADQFVVRHYQPLSLYSEGIFKSPQTHFSSKKFALTFMQEHIHFFLMDLDKLLMNFNEFNHYLDYEGREKDYGKSLLSSYNTAFSIKLPAGKISPELICTIHGYAINHLDKSPGQYRKQSGYLELDASSDKIGLKSPNASIDGIMEFTEKWFIQELKPIHLLYFQSTSLAKPNLFLYPCGYLLELVEQKDSSKRKLLNLKDFRKELTVLLSDSDYSCFIHFAPSTTKLLECAGYSSERIDEVMAEKLQLICDRYNSAIQKAVSAIQKIIVIITACREINQLHPFRDGNARTCRVLMDRLLHEANLPLTLHMNINRLDAFSIDQLAHFVVAGQQRFLKLCYEKQLAIVDDPLTPPAKLPQEAVSIPEAKAEIAEFVKNIQENLQKFSQAQFEIIKNKFTIRHYQTLPSYENRIFLARKKKGAETETDACLGFNKTT